MRGHPVRDQERTREYARTFFEGLWRQGDFWQLETSEFERKRHERNLELLADRRYARVLEIGCGGGAFTRRLASLADYILALDVAPAAIRRAEAAAAGRDQIEYRVANVIELDLGAEGLWDLIVLSETIYYLGWLYSFYEVGWFASELFERTRPGGRLLLSNAEIKKGLLDPSIIRTYRSLFLNVGFSLEREEIFRGDKEGTALEVLLSLFHKERRP
jgi:2-polyprenyl-3-methyl-5-hydroxy-6-metoxy-1,4-benzoquinol methylase